MSTLRERLEGLPGEALRRLARGEGIEVPDDVERILLVDLLLEVLEDKLAEQDSQNGSVRLQQAKYDLSCIEGLGDDWGGEVGFFPLHYNETRIVLMLRDPFWAFAYWDIRGGTLRNIKKEHEADGVFLRVLKMRLPSTVLDSFDIPVGVNDSSRYVNIPEQDALYAVELVLQGKTWEKSLIRSNCIRVPRAVYTGGILEGGGSPQRISSPQTERFLDSAS